MNGKEKLFSAVAVGALSAGVFGGITAHENRGARTDHSKWRQERIGLTSQIINKLPPNLLESSQLDQAEIDNLRKELDGVSQQLAIDGRSEYAEEVGLLTFGAGILVGTIYGALMISEIGERKREERRRLAQDRASA